MTSASSLALRASTFCFHYLSNGQRCGAACLDPSYFCCGYHLHHRLMSPLEGLFKSAAEAILECTRFTTDALPYLACTNVFAWRRLCNAINGLSVRGYQNDAELLTGLVSSIESIGGPWRGLPYPAIRKGRPFERLITRLYLEELSPQFNHAPTLSSEQESVRVLWNQRVPSLPGGKSQIDVLLRRTRGQSPTLTIVECRDHEVEVDEMRAFTTLVRHVKADHGVVVSSVGFQSGARRCAEYEGIELRIVTEDDFSQGTVTRLAEAYAFEPIAVWAVVGGSPVQLPLRLTDVHHMRAGLVVGSLAELVDAAIQSQAPQIQSMPPRIRFETQGSTLEWPGRRRLEPDSIVVDLRIDHRVRAVDLLLPSRPLSFVVNLPQAGKQRRVAAESVPLFPTHRFEPGRFYTNLMGQHFHCAAVDETSAKVILLADRQGETTLDVEAHTSLDQATHFYSVDDRKAIKSLKKDLKRFLSLPKH